MMPIKTFLSVAALLIISGCGNRTLDDYKRDKAMEDENRIQSAVGSYRGELRSSKNKEALGALQLDLEVDRRVNAESQSEISTLKATLFFSGKSPTYMRSTQTYYDWENGRMNAEFSLPSTKQGAPILLRLEGQLNNGKLEGTVANLSFEKNSADFELKKINKSENAEMFLRSGQIAPELIGKDEVEILYSGVLDFEGAATNSSRITLLISNSDLEPSLKFAELLSPQKTVRSVLAISKNSSARSERRLQDGFSITFNNGTWEPGIGSLRADYQSQNPMDRSHFALRCAGEGTDEEPVPSKINCRYQSSERGITHNFRMQREAILK